jgi:hypothetical protein
LIVFFAEKVAKEDVVLDFKEALFLGIGEENLSSFKGGDGSVEVEFIGKGVGNDPLGAPSSLPLKRRQFRKGAGKFGKMFLLNTVAYSGLDGVGNTVTANE